jgi:hypothetical protein
MRLWGAYRLGSRDESHQGTATVLHGFGNLVQQRLSRCMRGVDPMIGQQRLQLHNHLCDIKQRFGRQRWTGSPSSSLQHSQASAHAPPSTLRITLKVFGNVQRW